MKIIHVRFYTFVETRQDFKRISEKLAAGHDLGGRMQIGIGAVLFWPPTAPQVRYSFLLLQAAPAVAAALCRRPPPPDSADPAGWDGGSCHDGVSSCPQVHIPWLLPPLDDQPRAPCSRRRRSLRQPAPHANRRGARCRRYPVSSKGGVCHPSPPSLASPEQPHRSGTDCLSVRGG